MGNAGSARTKGAEADRADEGLVSQRVEHGSEDGAGERRVQIEDCGAREIRRASVSLNEARVVEVQGTSRSAGTFDIRGLKFDAGAGSAAANGSQQGDMTQAGAEIDEGIVFGKRDSAEKIKDMARRGGLISDHFGIWLDESRR